LTSAAPAARVSCGYCLRFELDGVNQNVAVLFHPGYMGAPTISEVVLTLDVDDVIRFGEFCAPVQEKAVESIFAGEHEPHPVHVRLFHGADPIAAEVAHVPLEMSVTTTRPPPRSNPGQKPIRLPAARVAPRQKCRKPAELCGPRASTHDVSTGTRSLSNAKWERLR